MKYRCQCQKPDYFDEDILFGCESNILHFKKATHFCSKCGVGICGDCMMLDAWEKGHDPWGRAIWKNPDDVRVLCQSCAELEGR